MNPKRALFPVGGMLASAIVWSLAGGCATAPVGPPRAATADVYQANVLSRLLRSSSQTRPVYPFAMRRAGSAGDVVVEFVVDTNGDVREARAISATNDEFAAAGVQCIETWKFSPGLKNSQPVNAVMRVPFSFNPGP